MLPHHELVLRAMYNLYKSNPDFVYTFATIRGEVRHIGEPWQLKPPIEMPLNVVRRIVRHLRKLKLVEYSICVSEDDGLLAGSGHWIVAAGIDHIQKLDAQRKSKQDY